MRTFIYTFGCKVNQVESERIINSADSYKFSFTDKLEEAELVVINSCAVTEKAEKKFKNLITKLKKNENPPLVAVTGCAAEKDREKLKNFGADIVVTNSGKTDILEYVLKETDYLSGIFEPHRFISAENEKMTTRTRAFIKIQDGCDSMCAYCIIPSLRGKPFSRDANSIISEVKLLAQSGHKEMVPVGIHVGKYGSDLKTGINLPGLIKMMLETADGFRIRLTSIELNELTDEMTAMLVSNSSRICRHYHIPLQSGSTEILKKMNRNYTAEQYVEKCRMLKKLIPGCTIGADIIVGFPGETDKNFEETLETVEKAGIDHIHVFAYSDRSGTAASLMKDKVSHGKKAERAAVLRKIAAERKYQSAKQMIGATLPVLVQNNNTGLTDNFFSVNFSITVEQNTLLDVKVTDVGNDSTLSGEILNYE